MVQGADVREVDQGPACFVGGDEPAHAVGGALWSGANAAQTMRLAADDVTEIVLDDCGHYPAEEQPARLAEVLEDFLGRSGR
ncbi:alpha/beta fold hydrolase [Streptomyces bauhiniae]